MCLSFKFPLYSLPSPYPHIQDTRQNSCVFQIRTLCDYWLLRVVQHLGSCWNPRTVQRISFLSLLTSHRYDAYCLLVNCIDVSLPNCTSFLKGVYVPPFSCWLNNFYAYKNCQKNIYFQQIIHIYRTFVYLNVLNRISPGVYGTWLQISCMSFVKQLVLKLQG